MTRPRLAEGLDAYIEAFRAASAGASSPNAARLLSDRHAGSLLPEPLPSLESFTTFIVAAGREIAVRVHRPRVDHVVPGIVYYHGGGFVAGSIESFDGIAQQLATHCHAATISVQYRRLPEHRYADTFDDCVDAFVWAREHAAELGLDHGAIAVAGDSVGALLALSVAMRARQTGDPMPAAQLLFYGAYSMLPGRDLYAAGNDPLLGADRIAAVVAAFEAAGGTPPDHSPKRLMELPPTLLVAAEHDPLRAETAELARALTAAGVAAQYRVAPKMIHGFLRAGRFVPAVTEEWPAIGAWFRRTVAGIASQEAA